MDWRYYNQGILPKTAPHEVPDITPIKDGSIWRQEWRGRPLLVRWTTEYDCGYDSNWWYCIKDTIYDIQSCNSKIRYEIKRASRNFYVEELDPREYIEEIIDVQANAWKNYPKEYRPKLDMEKSRIDILGWKDKYRVFGAFEIENGLMAAYALISEKETWVEFTALKAKPEYERSGANVALCAKICQFYNSFIEKGGYICDGERNVIHETAFQDFLIRKFGFRRAYCKLNIVYRKPIGFLVNVIYPFRGIISKMKKQSLMKKIDAILLMESICREQR